MIKLGWKSVALVLGAGALVLYAERKKLARLNPASTNNYLASGLDSVTAQATGGQYLTTGGWLWSLLNPGAAASEQNITSPTALDTTTPHTVGWYMANYNMTQSQAAAAVQAYNAGTGP